METTFQKPSKTRLLILFFMVAFTAGASYVYGSRGFFVGICLIYFNATIDLLKQLPGLFERRSKPG